MDLASVFLGLQDGFARGRRRQYRVAKALENDLGQVQDGRFIFHQENGFNSTGNGFGSFFVGLVGNSCSFKDG